MIDDSVAWKRKKPRQKLLDTLRKFEQDMLIEMEACSPLITGENPQCDGIQHKAYPCSTRQSLGKKPEDDANDALAIC